MMGLKAKTNFAYSKKEIEAIVLQKIKKQNK